MAINLEALLVEVRYALAQLDSIHGLDDVLREFSQANCNFVLRAIDALGRMEAVLSEAVDSVSTWTIEQWAMGDDR